MLYLTKYKRDTKMINRVKDAREYRTEFSAYTIETWQVFFERNRLDLNPDYQRDYVWGFNEQQSFLHSVVLGLPLSAISVIKKDDDFIYEVVDGKQRLTTLKLFFDGEIALHYKGESIFFHEMSSPEQLAFTSAGLPMIRLHKATQADKLKYFLMLNFGGVPQSEEHKNKVLQMLGDTIIKM